MTEAQFQAVVRYFEQKVKRISVADDSDAEPWHVALRALTGEYTDITRFEVVQSVRALASEASKKAYLAYQLLGADSLAVDAEMFANISLVLEMAEFVATAGQVLALPEGDVA